MSIPELRPIERDESYDRTYIPMPGDWEIQTKGKGSSFRICGPAPEHERLNIPPSPYLYETLERMAREVHAAGAALLKRAEDAEIEVNDCHRVYERDVGQLTLDLQAAEAAREADKVDAIHYARLQDLLNWLIGAPRENQQLKHGEAAESLRVLLSAERVKVTT